MSLTCWDSQIQKDKWQNTLLLARLCTLSIIYGEKEVKYYLVSKNRPAHVKTDDNMLTVDEKMEIRKYQWKYNQIYIRYPLQNENQKQ